MPFCPNCGSKNDESVKFCMNCGTNLAQQSPQPPPKPEPVAEPVMAAQSLPQQKEYIPPPSPPKTASTSPKNAGSPLKWLWIAAASLLAVGLIVMGVLYFGESSKLKEARVDIANLEDNVASLETQLSVEKTRVAGLEQDLSAEKTKVTNLETELTTAKGDITRLQADLDTSKARVATLETDLATSKARVTTLESDIAKANAEITTLKATNTGLNTELTKIKDPRHFNSLAELQSWLQKDDTNTKYASYSLLQKCYILQIKALRDGFIISTLLETDGSQYYVGNEAVIGNTVYFIDVDTDETTMYFGGFPSTPSHPLPLP